MYVDNEDGQSISVGKCIQMPLTNHYFRVCPELPPNTNGTKKSELCNFGDPMNEKGIGWTLWDAGMMMWMHGGALIRVLVLTQFLSLWTETLPM
jgi:hypothetical protein